MKYFCSIWLNGSFFLVTNCNAFIMFCNKKKEVLIWWLWQWRSIYSNPSIEMTTHLTWPITTRFHLIKVIEKWSHSRLAVKPFDSDNETQREREEHSRYKKCTISLNVRHKYCNILPYTLIWNELMNLTFISLHHIFASLVWSAFDDNHNWKFYSFMAKYLLFIQ